MPAHTRAFGEEVRVWRGLERRYVVPSLPYVKAYYTLRFSIKMIILRRMATPPEFIASPIVLDPVGDGIIRARVCFHRKGSCFNLASFRHPLRRHVLELKFCSMICDRRVFARKSRGLCLPLMRLSIPRSMRAGNARANITPPFRPTWTEG